ncbi:trigger factor [Labrys neptuniae]|uniref:Trigger factor n=1 Tax=Labrys neptuniae TaxID=376174 RepID=A0ABV3PMS6_9HYPH
MAGNPVGDAFNGIDGRGNAGKAGAPANAIGNPGRKAPSGVTADNGTGSNSQATIMAGNPVGDAFNGIDGRGNAGMTGAPANGVGDPANYGLNATGASNGAELGSQRVGIADNPAGGALSGVAGGTGTGLNGLSSNTVGNAIGRAFNGTDGNAGSTGRLAYLTGSSVGVAAGQAASGDSTGSNGVVAGLVCNVANTNNKDVTGMFASTANTATGGATNRSAGTNGANVRGPNAEAVPAIEIKDLASIKVIRPVYDVSESDVDERLKRVAEAARSYKPKNGKAAEGDRITIDYAGNVSEVIPNDTGTNRLLVLGAKNSIPGFDDQLIGTKAGDEKQVNVTFPKNYQVPYLAGKQATFNVTVKEVARPGEALLNDETAKRFGVDSLARLRTVVRGQIENQFGSLTRQKEKRQLVEQLEASYQFQVPSKLVEAEFNNNWAQVNRNLQASGRTFADFGLTEDKARAEYMQLAERRTRLGLILVEIGRKANISVSNEELQRGLLLQIGRYPANQQQHLLALYRSKPQVLNALRAQMFEDKVVDYLLGQVSLTEKKVSKKELMAIDATANANVAPKPATKATVKTKAR